MYKPPYEGGWATRGASLDRSRIDRSNRLQVAGTGNIRVDVRTGAQDQLASTEGLFSPVPIERMTQMQQAEQGPSLFG